MTLEQGEARIDGLIKKIIRNIYNNVSRGIFEEHKKILSFLIAVNLKLMVGKIPSLKWELLLKGCGIVDRKN